MHSMIPQHVSTERTPCAHLPCRSRLHGPSLRRRRRRRQGHPFWRSDDAPSRVLAALAQLEAALADSQAWDPPGPTSVPLRSHLGSTSVSLRSFFSVTSKQHASQLVRQPASPLIRPSASAAASWWRAQQRVFSVFLCTFLFSFCLFPSSR